MSLSQYTKSGEGCRRDCGRVTRDLVVHSCLGFGIFTFAAFASTLTFTFTFAAFITFTATFICRGVCLFALAVFYPYGILVGVFAPTRSGALPGAMVLLATGNSSVLSRVKTRMSEET